MSRSHLKSNIIGLSLLLASTSLALAQSKDFVWDPSTGKTNSETETHGTAPTPTCTPQSSPFLVSTTDCSVTCGGGTQTQTWSNGCPDGTSTQQVSCNTNECPKDWGTYTKIGDTVTHENGTIRKLEDFSASTIYTIHAALDKYQEVNNITNTYECPETSNDKIGHIKDINFYIAYTGLTKVTIYCGGRSQFYWAHIEYHICQ